MKLSSKMLQNLPYFWNNKTHTGFFHFSFRATFDTLVYVECRHKPGHLLGKTKLLAITLRIIAITITIMAKKLIDYCNNQ